MLEMKQSHFTLDIGKHLKDAANAVSFPIEASKEFYEGVTEGTVLSDEFRKGSFWTEGSIGSWTITVVKKQIVTLKPKVPAARTEAVVPKASDYPLEDGTHIDEEPCELCAEEARAALGS